MKIRIAKIFESISGEVGGFSQGSPCTFVRLAGCSLGCPFCDTKQWQDRESGIERTIEDVVQEIFAFPWKQVLITGGEPMEQAEAVQTLVNMIKGNSIGYKIQVETNGTIPLDEIYLVDYWVVDRKGEDSMGDVPYVFNPMILGRNVWFKCLVGGLDDLDSALSFAEIVLNSPNEHRRPRVAISPVRRPTGLPDGLVDTFDEMIIREILASRLPILFNVQLHKVLGVR